MDKLIPPFLILRSFRGHLTTAIEWDFFGHTDLEVRRGTARRIPVSIPRAMQGPRKCLYLHRLAAETRA